MPISVADAAASVAESLPLHYDLATGKPIDGRCDVADSFKEALETLVNQRIAQGEDPKDLFEELNREANHVFGQFDLEYELGLIKKADATD